MCKPLLAIVLSFMFLFAPPTWATELPKARTSEELGLSSARLKRLTDVLNADVASGEMPGAVVLIVRRGKIAYQATVGFSDREARTPMKPDAIFRIASMTKPIVSLAAMILQEEGKLGLGDPVSRYLPELKGMQVATEKAGADGRKELVMEPVQQEMTVQDLLRHTSGLTYGSYRRDMVSDLYRDANLFEPGSSLTDMIAKLSKLPLAFQPGTTWDYGVSIDVLGRIVEVASGMDLANFINQRITTPLGMNDTGFWVEHRKLSRLAQPQLNSATGKRPALHDVATRPTLFSGGGGMVSTARDYARLCQMFLNGGSLDGVRLVSRKTIAQMTADQLPLGVKAGVPFAPRSENGQGFGLGFAVRTAEGRNPNPGSIGDYGWTGSSGTTFWIDPKEQLFVIALTQEPAVLKRYISLLRSLVYQSITD